MADQDITLGMVFETSQAAQKTSQEAFEHSKMVLEHSQNNHEFAMREMKRLHEETMKALLSFKDSMIGELRWIKSGIKNLDERMDAIEIGMIEQQHEKRIVRLEKHAGFATAA